MAAWMWGTPWASRWTVTGAERPGRRGCRRAGGGTCSTACAEPEAGGEDAGDGERCRRTEMTEEGDACGERMRRGLTGVECV